MTVRDNDGSIVQFVYGDDGIDVINTKYLDKFEAVYAELAQEYNGALIPFLLEDVAARPKLNQVDGIHPTAEGHELVAMRVWNVLEGLLR